MAMILSIIDPEIALLLSEANLVDLKDIYTTEDYKEMLERNPELLSKVPKPLLEELLPELSQKVIAEAMKLPVEEIAQIIKKNPDMIKFVPENKLGEVAEILMSDRAFLEQAPIEVISALLPYMPSEMVVSVVSQYKDLIKKNPKEVFAKIAPEHIAPIIAHSPELLKKVPRKHKKAIYSEIAKRFDLLSKLSPQNIKSMLGYIPDDVLEKLVIAKPELLSYADVQLKLISNTKLMRKVIENMSEKDFLSTLPNIPLTLSDVCYRKLKQLYGDEWTDKLLNIANRNNADILFLATMFERSIETNVILGKLSKMVSSPVVKKISTFLFGTAPYDKDEISAIVDEFPQITFWAAEKDPDVIMDKVESILDRFPDALDDFLQLGGVVALRALKWLREKVKNKEIPVKEAVRIITQKSRPFSTVELAKVKTVKDFDEALKKMGVEL